MQISDPHCGYELGLTNPDTNLTDQYGAERPISSLNESQKFVWDTYLQGLEFTRELAGKDPVHLMFIGDLTHGNRFHEEQISTRMSDQIMYGVYALDEAYKLPNVKSSRMALGTGAHVFGQGSSEVLLASMMRDRYPKINTRALYHGCAEYGGFTIDFAHHGPPPGSRNWLRGNVARLYLQSKMMDDLDAGVVPADMVVRGHYHTYVKTWYGMNRNGMRYESWLIIMPSLCLMTDHSRKVTASAYRVSPGIVVNEIVNGKLLETYPITRTLDLRTIEVL